ncbi:hypothetical protein Tco_1313282 [Tanacetum coccineum]
MALCTTLQSRVLALETINTTQATEIASLKKRVKKLEKRNSQELMDLKDYTELVIQEGKGLLDIHEQEQAPTPTVSLQQPSQVKVQDKGKGKMVEPEPVKKMSKKELHKAKVDADYQLAQRLQAQEQDELTDEERGRLFEQFLETKKNTFLQLSGTELVEESSKKAETDQEESSKKADAKIAQESSLKRAGKELEQESSKRKKLEEDKEF